MPTSWQKELLEGYLYIFGYYRDSETGLEEKYTIVLRFSRSRKGWLISVGIVLR